MIDEQERLRRLVQAGILLTSELSLDAVLQRLIETAADLTGARYAALGVIAPSGEALERFLTTGSTRIRPGRSVTCRWAGEFSAS